MAEYVFPVVGFKGSIPLHWGSHKGASDIFAPRGTPVVSVTNGKVISVGTDGLGGNNVIIKGDDGLTYYYAHLNEYPLVSRNQRVIAGTRLGSVGDSGNAKGTGPHLHIGIGYSIISGSGPSGGAGSGFDAVEFLNDIINGVFDTIDGDDDETPISNGGNGSDNGNEENNSPASGEAGEQIGPGRTPNYVITVPGIGDVKFHVPTMDDIGGQFADSLINAFGESISGVATTVKDAFINNAPSMVFVLLGGVFVIAGAIGLISMTSREALKDPTIRAVVSTAAKVPAQ